MRSRFIGMFVLVGMGIFGATPGCSPDPTPAEGTSAASPPVAANTTPMGGQVIAQIGTGQLAGHTYTHDHFKLSVTIPEEWYIQKQSDFDQLAQTGSARVMKQDANTQAAVQVAKQRTLSLLSAFRHPPGTPVPSNPSLILLAENMAILPGLKRGEDYLKLLQQSLGSLTVKCEVEPIETGFNIGSHPADRLVVHMQVADRKINQEYYAARAGDYFLVVILSSSEDAERDALRAILESLKAG